MRIGSYQPVTYTPMQVNRPPKPDAAAEGQHDNFIGQVKEAVDKVNTLQQTADTVAETVTAGNPEDAHKAMIAMEHALVALDFTLQVRNKVLEAYQEIMRTQV